MKYRHKELLYAITWKSYQWALFFFFLRKKNSKKRKDIKSSGHERKG